MADVTFSEKLVDIGNKVSLAWFLLKGVLPGGEFQLTSASIQNPHGTHTVRAFKDCPECVGDHYRRYMKANGDAEWLIYQTERITYRMAEQQMDALGAELASNFGVKPKTVVSILMRNCPEYMISFLGITAMGAVAVPLNSMWGTQELEYAVKDSGSVVIIGDIERLRVCLPFKAGTGVRMILCRGTAAEAREVGAELWSDVLQAGSGKPLPSTAGVKQDDEAMIMYTSGSTGFPKGAVHSQRSINTFLKIGILSLKLAPDPAPRCLMAVPLFHITALGGIFLLSMPRKEAIVLMYKWDAADALNIIEEEKISRFTGVPTMVRDMLEHPTFSAEKVATLKTMLAGGAPVPPSQVAKLREKARKVTSGQAYGLTETMGIATTNTGTDYLKNPTSAGRPLPLLASLVIKDTETGKVLPDGGRGEVCIKGPFLMKGYQNKPEETAKVFDADGYFHTGDVGELHGGFLYIKDRLKDIIIRGGENIDCAEVEAALYAHPTLRECSVFGIPDERLGEVVGAAVWLQGEGLPSREELAEVAKKSLASFKVPLPEHIFLRSEELPKGATGKIDKKGLREHYKAVAAGPPPSKL